MTLATQKYENPLHFWHDVYARRMSLKKCQPAASPTVRSIAAPIAATRVFKVSNTSDSGEGSLRAAILNANLSTASRNRITFAIGSGPQSIRLQFALPAITAEVIIDATGQPGFAGAPLIEIDGRDVSQAHCATIGLRLMSSNCTIKGLRIDHFTYGMKVQSAHGNTIEGNVIGARSAGGSPSVFTGIIVHGGHGNFIRGNSIVDSQGDGIILENCEANMIGGPFPWDANIISGTQDGSGVAFCRQSTHNVVHRNRLFGNAKGVWIDPSSRQNVVTSNRISRSTLAGIEVQGSDNFIGTKAEFNTVLGVDCGSGIVIENSGNSVDGNIVSGACYSGILLNSGAAETSLTNNVIFQNKGAGVDVHAADSNQIGDHGSGNSIYDNGSYGICMQCGSNYNTICGNSIHGNGAAGIHLAPGANDAQPAPLLTAAAVVDDGCSVAGTVRGASNATLVLDFFSSSPGMVDQGETALGAFNVVTNGLGEGCFAVTLPVAEGHVITATLTNTATGETSAFSNSLAAARPVSVPTSAGEARGV
jgi:parallel beta-helix repeat protein